MHLIKKLLTGSMALVLRKAVIDQVSVKAEDNR